MVVSAVSATSARYIFVGAIAAALLGGAVRLAASMQRHGATLEPGRLALKTDQTTDVELVLHELDVVAVRFRLRYDENVVTLDGARPEHVSMLAGGNAIHLPAQRSPGRLDVPGLAVIGGRTFAPGAPIYRFTVRGVSPGATTLVIEDLTIVDTAERERRVSVPPCRVTVSAS